jgi:hypothetical protein
MTVRRSSRDDGPGWKTLAMILAGVVAVGAATFFIGLMPAWVKNAEHWMVQGPPCPAITKAEFDTHGIENPQSMTFGDASFTRAYGHVACEEIHDKGGRGFGMLSVCQFSGPGPLAVRSAEGDAYYFIPGAKPAAVTVGHGKPACVIGTTEWDRMGG